MMGRGLALAVLLAGSAAAQGTQLCVPFGCVEPDVRWWIEGEPPRIFVELAEDYPGGGRLLLHPLRKPTFEVRHAQSIWNPQPGARIEIPRTPLRALEAGEWVLQVLIQPQCEPQACDTTGTQRAGIASLVVAAQQPADAPQLIACDTTNRCPDGEMIYAERELGRWCWPPISDPEPIGYTIEVSRDGSAFEKVADTLANWIEFPVWPGDVYRVRYYAWDPQGRRGDYSPDSCAVTIDPLGPVDAFTIRIVSPSASNRALRLERVLALGAPDLPHYRRDLSR